MGLLKVLVTGVGCPGIRGTLYALRNNKERELMIIGTDMDTDPVGKYLVDRFFPIHPADDPAYLEDIHQLCKTWDLDVIVPENTMELSVLSRETFNHTRVCVSSAEAIARSNNKYHLTRVAEKVGVPYPDSFLAKDQDEVIAHMTDLGWPGKQVVLKPIVGHGRKGVHVIRNNMFDWRYLKNDYPILVSSYLPGKEWTVDCFSDGEIKIVIPRVRDKIRSGITFNGHIERNEEIIEYCHKLIDELKLEYAFGFQFKEDAEGTPKLLECNPRVQGTMITSVLAGANLPYFAVKQAIGESVTYPTIDWDYRIKRYWGCLGISSKDDGWELI